MGGRRDFVSVIEAAYAHAPTEQAWLDRIVEQTEGCLGFCTPVSAYVVDASDPARPRVGLPAVRGVPVEAFACMTELTNGYAPWEIRALYATHPAVTLLSKVLPSISTDNNKLLDGMLGGVGVCDVLGIRGIGLDRRGVMLCPAFVSKARPVAARTRMALGRVARHLATAYRLRQRHQESPDAILTPSGRVEHVEAEGSDQRALAEIVNAAKRIGLARGKLRREEPERAVELWRALVSGRWSVVESVESDGKRYLLARRNDLGVPHPRALTPSEAGVLALAAAGHSNKAMAYELGLSPSRVSRLLHEAMSKLAMRSRAELVAYRDRQTT